jgi:transposase InsO family protein
VTLTCSSLHRCFQYHGSSCLSDVKGDKPARKKFKTHPLGYFHIDITEMRTEEGKLYLFVAIDRTSKYEYAELHSKYGKMEAVQFLRNLIAKLPETIHTVLTDYGIQFTNRARDIFETTHIFDWVCREHGIEHCLTKVNHPWTNSQVERMNHTLKEAIVKR